MAADNFNLPRPDMTMAEELMFRLYAVMEDDGGGKDGEYLLMGDNVVTPVHNVKVEKDMEMGSEPYELQPLGMASFTPQSTHPEVQAHTPELDNMEPVPAQDTTYMSYPPPQHRDEGMHQATEPTQQLVNNHQQQQLQQQQQPHGGTLVTDNHALMSMSQQPSEPRRFMPEPNIPPQNSQHSMFVMNKPDILNNSSTASTPVSSNESLSMGSPASTPDLGGMAPPPKHAALAAASAKSRRKHDRILPVESTETKEKYICPVCKMELFTASSLTKHIRSHNATTATATNINSCTICGKVLSSQSSLDRHMLVHSGERPFRCRFCNMSFTTNGNMHRHSRIHEKEGDIPLSAQNNNNQAPAQQQTTNNTVAKQQNRNPSNGSFMPNNNGQVLQQQQNIPPNRFPMEINGSQMGVPGMMGIPRRAASRSPGNSRPQSPARAANKRRIGEREPGEILRSPAELSDVLPSKRPAREELETMPAVHDQRSPMEGMHALAMSTPTAPVFPYMFPGAPTQTSPSPDGNNNRRKQVTSIAANDGSDGEQTTTQGQSQSKGQASASSSASSSPAAKTMVPVGFTELSFTEFTGDKFALIARSFCERNPRRASSIFFNFTCIDCDRAFPCPTSLAVHRNTHMPGSTVNCGECQCWFDNPVQQRGHQLKHMGQKVMEYFAAATKDKDIDDVQEEISKEEFLCSMGLQLAKKDDKPKIHNAFPRFDQKVNRDYFTRFNQINFSEYAQIARGFIDVKQEPMEDDFADINQILKMTSSSGMPNVPSRPSLLPRPAHLRYSPSTASSSASTMSNDMLYNISADGKESYICKFCGEKFDNLRNYKGHVRSHLGLAAYKCNLCSYSSADKSTLIRHLRTHNGERPFQCLICDFAFTTKANCERHVKKKHGKSGKQEIEDSIGYNDTPSDGMADVDAFASPDTVCKYCGEDFKFFRALKHHLRSHSSCRSKPYVCRLCTTGFSTKANCVRHIQKQHLEISQSQLEDCIQVNEMLLLEGREEAHESEEGGRSACSSPISSSISQRMSPIPPPAHMSSPRGRCSTQTSPRSLFLGTSPMAGMRREWGTGDQPIDFSMKSAHSSPVPAHRNGLMPLTPSSSTGGDEPMDLSVHSRSSSCESSPAPGALRTRGHGAPFQPSAYSLQLSANLQVHLRSHTNERPFICNLCNAGFTIKTNLERHLKTRHGADFHPDLMTTTNCDSIVAGDHDYYGQQMQTSGEKDIAMETNNNNPDKPCNNLPATQSASAIDASIAAYKKMFGSERLTDSMERRIEMTTAAAIENAAKQKALEMAHKGHLSGGGVSVLQSTEINNNDETAEGLHGKLKDRNFYMSEQSAKTKQLLAAKLLERQASSGQQDVQDMPSQMIPTIRVMDNKNAVDMQTAAENELKKKRNSYADSPHRLVCPYCPRAFPWISSLNRHILTHTGQKPFKCPQCPVMFSTKSNRERHLVRKHGLNVLDPATRQMMDRPFKCHLCVFSSFSTSGNLIRHYKEKHPETEPPDHIIAAGEAALKEQQENGIFNESDDLIIDEEEINSNPSSPVRPSQVAPDDGDAAQVKRIIMEHMINNPPPRVSTPYTPPDTPDRGINPERDNYNVDKITECWVCANTFDSRKSLLRHLKEHNIDLPYKCYLCDASFSARIECLQHKRDQHAGDWNVLKDKNHIDHLEHFVRVMNAIVNQNLGPNADASVEDYKVSGDDLMKYRVSMGEDMKPESDYTQRKVYCSLCPKRFWSLQDLRRHMRSHTGEKPFECDICQKRFTLKHSMVRHRRKHAGADAGAASMSASDEENTPEETQSNQKRSGANGKNESAQPAEQPAAKIRRLNDGTQAVLFNLRGGIGSLGGLGSDSSDLLQNLLGVEETAIDKMLDSNADSAAKLLGV